jgi:hypothetical protein
MRCYYLNFTNYRFDNCQETSREKKKHAFDYIMNMYTYWHNTAIHNHVFKNHETVNKMVELFNFEQILRMSRDNWIPKDLFLNKLK